jgi:hypothetical protein
MSAITARADHMLHNAHSAHGATIITQHQRSLDAI